MIEQLQELAEAASGKIEEVTLLPDGHGYAVMSLPLPEDHWIYGDPTAENHREGFSYEPPPMPLRVGQHQHIWIGLPSQQAGVTTPWPRERLAEAIRAAGRYAVRAATMQGREMDFDPDALIQNLVVGILGYWTANGLTDDEWANPHPIESR